MNHNEIVLAVIQLIIIALEAYFIVWTIKNVRKIQDKQEIMWEEIQQIKRDSIKDFEERKNLEKRIKEIENKNTPE